MKKRWKQRGLSLLLAAVLLAQMVPLSSLTVLTARAAEEPEIPDLAATTTIIEAGETTLDGNTLENKKLEGVEGSPTIVVKDGATLTLKNITVVAAEGQSAIYIEKNATLIIEGEVNVTGGNAHYKERSDKYMTDQCIGAGAGIEVPEDSSLTLKGTGVLTATGGNAGDGKDAEQQIAGGGGGGGGAGIGSKGASYHADTPHAGAITIDDKYLKVDARGGAGGNGGRGADGQPAHLVWEYRNNYIVYIYNQSETHVYYRGGAGGGGGGGGGYPGAGIGSGGAAGYSGCSGGNGGDDVGRATRILTLIPLCLGDDICVSGGGGGAGGWGYVNGGGGGGGSGAAGYIEPSFSPDKYGTYIYIDGTNNVGKGGAPGQDGAEITPSVYTFHGVTYTSAKPGISNGAGGAAGQARDHITKSLNGKGHKNVSHSNETLSGRVGGVTIKSGLVLATSGGTETNHFGAQDVGGGGALFGSQASGGGWLKILGGSLHTANGKLVTPVNEAGATLYPVTLSGQASNEKLARPTVTVNGTDRGVTRYNTSDRKVTLWLPDGTHTVTIVQPGAIEYEVTVTNGKVSYQTTEPQIHLLDLSKGTLWINGTSWAQGDVNGEFYDDANIIVYGKGNITVGSNPANYPYNITMDGLNGCTVYTLRVSSSYVNDGNKKARLNLTVTGTENKIGTLTAMDPNSQITIDGDEDSNLNIERITAADWKAQPDIISTREVSGGHAIGELVLGIGDWRNNAIANLKKVEINGVSPILIEPRIPTNVNLASKSKQYLVLGYFPVDLKVPETSPLDFWYDPRYTNKTKILYDILLVEAEVSDKVPIFGSFNLPYGRYELVYIENMESLDEGKPPIAIGTAGDLMLYNRKEKLHRLIYALYSDEVNWEKWSTRPKEEQKPITHIEQWLYKWNTQEVCRRCYPYTVPLVNVGEDAKGNKTVIVKEEDPIWQVFDENDPTPQPCKMAYSRSWGEDLLNGQPYKCMKPGLSSYHGGTVVTNSKGKVVVEKFGSQGTKEAFYGTPNLVVNSGYMEIQELALSQLISWYNLRYEGYMSPGQYSFGSYTPHYISGCSETTTKDKVHHSKNQWFKYISWVDVFGSNRLGNVTVKASGTLKVGKDGTGSLVQGNEFMKAGRLTVEPGGMLYSSDSLTGSVEITGLPPNTHLFPIKKPDGEGILGHYNWDVWTDGNGTLRTIIEIPSDKKEKFLILTDKDGNPYQYTISFDGAVPEVKNSLSSMKYLPHYDKTWVYPNYILVQNSYGHPLDISVYSRENKMLIAYSLKEIFSDVYLCDGAELILDTKDTVSIPKIIGDGTLTLTGAGCGRNAFNISVTFLIVESGTIDGYNFSGCQSIQINGGSVKNHHQVGTRPTHKALTAFNKDGERLYLTILPWSTDVSVDGEPYPVSSGSCHTIMTTYGKDSNMYLYLPATAKVVRTKDENGQTMAYMLSPDESKHMMTVTEAISGDGVIDLNKDTVDIRSDNLYLFNNKLYYNENGNTYTVTGTASSSGTPLTVSGKDITITLKDANLTSKKQSPVALTKGGTATVILKGNNTLKGAENYPAVLVPEGTELSVRGEGVLNASGGAFAAAIGGSYGSPNGKITLMSGTLNLSGDNNVAVGAGADSFTPEGSIIIAGGAVKAWTNLGGSAFGTAVQDVEGTPLALLVVPHGEQSVQIDGRDCGAKSSNDDGMWYFYVPQQKTTVTADGKEYMAMPLTFGKMENGSISAFCERNGKEIDLKDGDMVIEGMPISLTTVPDEGYGLKSGPDTGSYTVIRAGDDLCLSPDTGITFRFQTQDDWMPVVNQSSRSLDALEKEIDGESVLSLGTTEQGTAVLNLSAQGNGVTAEVLVGGEVKETLLLRDTPQTLSCQWESDGIQEVTVRFTGKGKASVTTMLLGNQVLISDLKAAFSEVVTFDCEKMEGVVDENGNRQYFLTALKEDGSNFIALNNFMPGIQLFKGEELKLSIRDSGSGSIFDGFVLSWEDGTIETKKENPLTITLNQSVKAKMTYHLEACYEVVIPEEIAMSDKGASADISANTIKNMQPGDMLNVSVSGLDENGNATLTRLGTQDTLAVPVMDKDKNSLKENGLAAQFTEDVSQKTTGGTVYFGTPAAMAGDRKAGAYKGTITFIITYQPVEN